MAKVGCSAACQHADLYKEICTKEHIKIVYRKDNLDWPCSAYEPRAVQPTEFAKCLLITTALANPQQAHCFKIAGKLAL